MNRWVHLTCVALFAGATASHSAIVHHPTHFFFGYVWSPNVEFFELDVDADGSVDFTLQASTSHFSRISASSQNRYLIHRFRNGLNELT